MERGATVSVAEEGGIVESGRGEGGKAKRRRLRRWAARSGGAKGLRQAKRGGRSAALASDAVCSPCSSSSATTRHCAHAELRLPTISLSLSSRSTGLPSRRKSPIRRADEGSGGSIALVPSTTSIGAARAALHASGARSRRVRVGVLRSGEGHRGRHIDDVLGVGRGGVDSRVLVLVRVAEVGTGYGCEGERGVRVSSELLVRALE